MKILLPIVFCLTFINVKSQEKGNSRIIVTLPDTAGIYEKAKTALIKEDFAVKDLANRDTIFTYPRDLKSMSGSAVAMAVIDGNKVTISGIYSRKKISYYGVIKSDKNHKPIVYYKDGKLWPLLIRVAKGIGADVTFAE